MSERKPRDIPSIIFIIALSIAVLFYSYSYYQETMIKVEASKTLEQKQAEKQVAFKQDSINNVCELAKEKCEWCENHNRTFTDADIGIGVSIAVIVLLVCASTWAFKP